MKIKYWKVHKYVYDEEYNTKYPLYAEVEIVGEKTIHHWRLPKDRLFSEDYDWSEAIEVDDLFKGDCMNLKELPALEILKLLKKSLTDTGDFQGDFEDNQSFRWAIIEEIQRRGGKNFLRELNWPDVECGVYKNRYTASEETLEEIYEDNSGEFEFKEWLDKHTPFLCENWLPKCQWVDDECFSEYLPKNKLTRWL